jgi:hypothetical protein
MNLKTLTPQEVASLPGGFVQFETVTNGSELKQISFHLNGERYFITAPYSNLRVEIAHDFETIDGFLITATAPVTGQHYRTVKEFENEANDLQGELLRAGYTAVQKIPFKLRRWFSDPEHLFEAQPPLEKASYAGGGCGLGQTLAPSVSAPCNIPF